MSSYERWCVEVLRQERDAEEAVPRRRRDRLTLREKKDF